MAAEIVKARPIAQNSPCQFASANHSFPVESTSAGAAGRIGLTRRECLAGFGSLAGVSALTLTGCEALQQLDTSARGEGTGLQIIGALVVLAKYQASNRQKTVAEQKSRRAFVDRAMKPALAAEKKKVRVRHERKLDTAKKEFARDATKREQSVVQLQREAESELASIETKWHAAAAHYTSGRYTADFAASRHEGTVAFTSVKDSDVLTASAAYVPRYLAVSVPPEKLVAGSTTSVMFWDAQSHRLAKDEVYALDREPKLGEVAKFDDIKAQYAER
ncbi:MAG: hypothetical protein ACR2OZ_16170 [Verrucomicrobiales bacterium]